MKRFSFFTMTLIGILLLTGCANSTEEPKREFYKNFSIGEIVEQNADYLIESSRVLGGSESGPPEPFVQRYEEISLQIDEANQAAFMLAMKTDIEKAIAGSGAEVQGYGKGGGTGSEYFSFDYRYDQVYGTIHVWAVKGPESNVNIIVLLTED